MGTDRYRAGHQSNKLGRCNDSLEEDPDIVQARATERYWRRVMVEFSATGLSGAEYCRRNGIKYQHFADWRLKIRKSDASGKAIGQRALRRAHVAEKSKLRGPKSSSGQHKSVEFAEIQVVDRQNPNQVGRTGEPARLELVFPGGVVLRLPDDCSLTFLSSVISILEKR